MWFGKVHANMSYLLEWVSSSISPKQAQVNVHPRCCSNRTSLKHITNRAARQFLVDLVLLPSADNEHAGQSLRGFCSATGELVVKIFVLRRTTANINGLYLLCRAFFPVSLTTIFLLFSHIWTKKIPSFYRYFTFKETWIVSLMLILSNFFLNILQKCENIIRNSLRLD